MAALSEAEIGTDRLHLEVWKTGRTAFFELGGELDPGTRAHLDAETARSSDCDVTVLDLRHLAFVDSQGVVALLAARARLEAAGAHVSVLPSLSHEVCRVLALTGAEAHLFPGPGVRIH